jgi:hypothetical protein
MSFHIGQKVICVRSLILLEGQGYGDEICPIAGTFYHIREIGIGLHHCYPDKISVRLHEIINKTRPYQENGSWEPAFCATRFHPIVERKTDIAVFKAMLLNNQRLNV